MAHRPTVILTRPREASKRFAVRLASEIGDRATILIAPILAIEPVPQQRDYSEYRTLVFTSSNAIGAIAEPDKLKGRWAYCVGDQTAEAALHEGFRAVSAGGDVEALIERLLADRPPGPWLHLAGTHRRGNLSERLSEAGHATDLAVVYRQEARPLEIGARDLVRQREAVLPVFSPRSAALLAAALPADARPQRVVAISEAAAAVWTGRAFSIHVAPSPTAEAMAQAILSVIETDSGC